MSKKNDEKVKKLAVETLSEIWKSIDWKQTNYKNIAMEFSNSVRFIATTTDRYEIFIEKLCRKLGIKNLSFPTISEISDMEESIKHDILKLFREQSQILYLKMKLNKQSNNEGTEKEL